MKRFMGNSCNEILRNHSDVSQTCLGPLRPERILRRTDIYPPASSTAVLICTRSVAPATSTRPLGLITAFQCPKFNDKNINIEIILNFAYLDPA
jgi:hypothetical protein